MNKTFTKLHEESQKLSLKKKNITEINKKTNQQVAGQESLCGNYLAGGVWAFY